jgi:hypothetical protein
MSNTRLFDNPLLTLESFKGKSVIFVLGVLWRWWDIFEIHREVGRMAASIMMRSS